MSLTWLRPALVLGLCFSACSPGQKEPVVSPDLPTEALPEAGEDPEAGISGAPAEDPCFPAYREQARSLAAALDDRSLAAQVIMTGIDGKGTLTAPMEEILREVPAGGAMLFRRNLDTDKPGIRSFTAEISRIIGGGTELGIIPFIAVDHEGGQVHRFGPEVGRLPPPLSYWDLAQREGRDQALAAVREDARQSGRELRDLGITLNFAPVAEILTEGNRPFLEDRSYGPEGEFTQAAAAAFIRGMEEGGIPCVVKHFPGNTGTDPHRGRPLLTQDRRALDRLARPFAGLIRELSLPGVMVSHVLVLARDPDRNASLSPAVIRDWLRGELGFSGMVLADDFSMEAASGRGEEDAAVEALAAGADMVMAWPATLRRTHRTILRALEDGRLPRERLREAVEHILFQKIRFGLFL
ncbi:glycoside hydrolase family 3 protein [Treponema sp. TIM-1]|uniref:glycoside hydrolase family 3 N-terminal domain-containing protein n=1 Tax=Treponema sp. TIM-1 TaxID=2898417 RepID=UPI00397F963F